MAAKRTVAATKPPVVTSAKTTVDLETRSGTHRPLDLTSMRSLELSLKDWSTGVDLIDLLLPTRGGAPVVHSYSCWNNGKGGVLGDRWFEPNDKMLTELRQRFDEPALIPGGTKPATI